MNLEELPRYRLAEFPTPVHHLESFSKACNGPAIFMKRDDITSLGMGGWEQAGERHQRQEAADYACVPD